MPITSALAATALGRSSVMLKAVIAWIRSFLRLDALHEVSRIEIVICDARDGIQRCRKRINSGTT